MRFKKPLTGFTLIELLVAISILAIVAVLGWRGLDSIARSRTALNADLELTRGLQLTFAQLQSDCSQIVNPLNYPNLPEGRSSWIEPQRLILIRNVFADAQSPMLQIVTYRIVNDNLTRFESIPTRDLTVLAQLLQQARIPPDNQVEIVMQKNVASLEFTGYPPTSLTGSTATPDQIASAPSVSSNPATSSQPASNTQNGQNNQNGSNPPVNIPVQTVNAAKVTTGLQVSLQLKNHDQTMLKIFILGGA